MFLASLDVSLSLIATIAQEIISLYKLWQRYQEDIPSVAGPASPGTKRNLLNRAKCGNGASGTNSKDGSVRGSQGGSPPHSTTPQVTTDIDSAGDGNGSADGTKMEGNKFDENSHDLVKISGGNSKNSDVVTASFLCQLLLRMRESRMADLMQSEGGRLAIANRLLERTQVAR
jgi:cyclin-C